ncbi:MAG TPA: type II toxin-antitoxin system VapC family toxin [Bryobacteraceae bacterium]
MRLLLDTSAFIWCLHSPERLSPKSQRRMEDPNAELLLSIASVWEMAIKEGSGKLSLKAPLNDIIGLGKERLFIGLLPIEIGHVIHTAQLPPHHRDPFDRLLIAQALLENLTIVTSDPKISRYNVQVLW